MRRVQLRLWLTPIAPGERSMLRVSGHRERPAAEQDADMVIATNDTPAAANSATVADQGLYVLVAFLRSHGIGVDPEQLRHRFGNAIGVPEMLRCAKELGLKARCFRT